MEVAGDADIINGYDSGLADGQLAPDHFADFALQKFANTLESEGLHGRNNSSRPRGGSGKSEFLGRFLEGITLDQVARLELVETIQPNAALHASPDLVDLVLETTKGK